MARIFLLIFFSSALLARAEDATAGRFEGVAQVPGRELKLIIDLARPNESWVGSITMPGRLIKGAALGDITVAGADVTFAIKGAMADAKGVPARCKLHVNGTKLSGEFLQGGNSAPVTLEKTGAPQVELPPPSTPIAKELEGEWRGEYELFGYSRKVTIKLTNRPSGGAMAEFVVVGKKVNNLPVDLVTQEGDLLTIDSSGTGLSYEGHLREGEIKGAIIQRSIETPLVLQRPK